MAPASRKEFLDIQANYRVWIHNGTCMWPDNNIQYNMTSKKPWEAMKPLQCYK